MTVARFGPFRLDFERRELTREGEVVPLGSRAFDILRVLVSAKGDLVTKDELMAQVWPGIAVEENNVQVHISSLRKALDNVRGDSGYIITIPGRGYRFVGLPNPPSKLADEISASQTLAPPDRPSIAVLAFVNLSGDLEQEYLADGISEDIITALTRYRWFFVVARNSSFVYKGRATDVKQIAGELGVRYVLEGSVRRSAHRVRITAQLVDASTGKHIWAERYDRELVEVLALQDEIAEQVAGAIEPELLKNEGGRATRVTGSLSAWDLVRQGTWYFNQLTEPTHLRARELFREAVKLDPQLSEGQAWLSRANMSLAAYGWSADRDADLREAVEAALKAVQLDEKDSYAHYALAMAYMHSGALEQAIRAAEKGVEINPCFALGHLGLGQARLYSGDALGAIEPLQHGIRLNPFDPQNAHWFRILALAQHFTGQPEQALTSALQALKIRPAWPLTLETAAVCYAALDRWDEARECVRQIRELAPPKGDPTAPLKVRKPEWAASMAAVLDKAGKP